MHHVAWQWNGNGGWAGVRHHSLSDRTVAYLRQWHRGQGQATDAHVRVW